MKITEIFDSSLNLDWEQQGRYKLAAFSVDGIWYQIQIEEKPIVHAPELRGKKTAEVSFFKKDSSDDEKAHSTANDQDAPSAVYGVVMNALKDQFAHYDAFYFSCEKRHSETDKQFKLKVRIYNYAASEIKHKYFKAQRYRFHDINLEKWIISKIPFTDKNFINEWLANLEFMKDKPYTRLFKDENGKYQQEIIYPKDKK